MAIIVVTLYYDESSESALMHDRWMDKNSRKEHLRASSRVSGNLKKNQF